MTHVGSAFILNLEETWELETFGHEPTWSFLSVFFPPPTPRSPLQGSGSAAAQVQESEKPCCGVQVAHRFGQGLHVKYRASESMSHAHHSAVSTTVVAEGLGGGRCHVLHAVFVR